MTEQPYIVGEEDVAVDEDAILALYDGPNVPETVIDREAGVASRLPDDLEESEDPIVFEVGSDD